MKRVSLALSLLALAFAAAVPPLVRASSNKSGKSHLGVSTARMCSLYTDSIFFGSGSFHYDIQGPAFTVPDGMSFVVTDITVAPDTASFAATDKYFVDIRFDVQGMRHYAVRSLGPNTFHVALAGGIVCASGSTPQVTNLPSSSDPVFVYLQGYFVKGSGLFPNQSPF